MMPDPGTRCKRCHCLIRALRSSSFMGTNLCAALIWLAVFCIPSPACAQYRFDVWTADDGLPQNLIRNIEQTPDGYLWIATFDGLARFDGVQFTVFNKSNTPGLTSNRFGTMYQDPSGDLWLTAEIGGVTRYHQGSFQTYGTEHGIPNNVIRGITGDDAGHIWILTAHTIAKWDEAAGRFIDISQHSEIHYEPLGWGTSGFWGLDKTNLLCFIKGKFVTYALPSWLSVGSIWEIASDLDGILWIETLDGKHVRISPNGKVAGPFGEAATTYLDDHGHSWKINIETRLSRSIEYLTAGHTETISFHSIYQDREKNLWVGSEGQGLYRFQPQSIRAYSTEQGLIDRDIYPIYQDRTDAVWIGAWHKGLSRYSQGKFTNYTIPDSPRLNLVTSISEDSKGALWVATHGGVRVFSGGVFRKPDRLTLPDGAVVQAMHLDRQGVLWLGTSNGLVSFENELSRTFTRQDGLAVNDVRAFAEGKSGDLWLGGYGGLTRYMNHRFTHWVEQDGLPSSNIRSIYVDDDGIVWIGTYDGGLGRFKDGKFTRYTVRDGLFNNGVFQILEDARGNLWMSCNRGIYRVSRNELNEFAAGKRSSITSIPYGKADGMLNIECNGGLSPAGIRARDGKLWFPTQDGVAVVDPQAVFTNLHPPPVVIESVVIDHAPAAFNKSILVKPGKENLEIQYTALSFIKSDQIHFRYRLEGLDSTWTDAGGRRTAYYPHLPPGKYLFQVIAGNSDGIWNNEGKTLSITVLAPFYRRWWFDLLVVLAIAALVTAAWRYRVAQLQQAHAVHQDFSRKLIESQENERTRIAAELHDGLGQRLVVIKNLTAFLLRSRKKYIDNLEVQTLEEVNAEAASAISEVREISYGLRPFQLDQLGLTNAIKATVRSVSVSSGIQFSTELDDIDNVFAEDQRINVYRIMQESLNNVMKHSQATQVSVFVKQTPGKVTLIIHDNGEGFTLIDKTSPAKQKGLGLTSMAERASLLGGDFKLRSMPKQGTTVTVEIPLNANDHEE